MLTGRPEAVLKGKGPRPLKNLVRRVVAEVSSPFMPGMLSSHNTRSTMEEMMTRMKMEYVRICDESERFGSVKFIPVVHLSVIIRNKLQCKYVKEL
jgi:hypothetical protein